MEPLASIVIQPHQISCGKCGWDTVHVPILVDLVLRVCARCSVVARCCN